MLVCKHSRHKKCVLGVSQLVRQHLCLFGLVRGSVRGLIISKGKVCSQCGAGRADWTESLL